MAHQYLPNQFSCAMVGEGALLVACGDMLLRHHHTIGLVASEDRTVLAWAKGKGIACISAQEELAKRLGQIEIDYLFSIANPHVLSGTVLRTAKRLAINYHDSLLPRYAGHHATSWAILNGESIHGVSWHVMVERVDCGPILRQVELTLNEDDTAQTANLKCFEAALQSFELLMTDLENGQPIFTEQDLSQRTFLPRDRRPSAAGVLCWGVPAEQISRLARALNFGTHPNPLGLPKLLIGQRLFIASGIEVMASSSAAPAGTVLAVEAEGLQVAATDRIVRVRDIHDLDGTPLNIPIWAEQHGVVAGIRLPMLGDPAVASISAASEKLARKETFWVRRLEQLQPLSIPYAHNPRGQDQRQVRIQEMPLAPSPFQSLSAERCGDGAADTVFAALVAYLARLSGEKEFDVGWVMGEAERAKGLLTQCCSPLVPHRVVGDGSRPVGQAIEDLCQQFAVTRAQGAYATDVVARYPALRQMRQRRIGSAFHVALCCAPSPDLAEEIRGGQLTFVLTEQADRCWWVYDPTILDDQSVGWMIEQFFQFCTAAVGAPSQMLGDVPILTQAQVQQLVVEWNQTRAGYPDNQCLHQMFEIQAEATPNATAAICGEERCTYAQLDGRANSIARNLRAAKIGRGSRVVLCVGRGVDAIAAMLGVLKAGAAYVPLDPTLPAHRADAIAALVRPQAIISNQPHWAVAEGIRQRLRTSTPLFLVGRQTECGGTDDEIIVLDDTRPSGAAHETSCSTTAGELAYVIFTSGSTGVPKGVAVSHRAAMNTIAWVNRVFGVGPGDVLLCVASFSFDLSVYDIFGALAAGATVRLTSDDEVQDPRRLLDIICREPVTFWDSAPAAMQQVACLFPDCPRRLSDTLRLVFLSGDWVPVSLPPLLKSRFPKAQVVALGGATEAAIWSNFFIVGEVQEECTSIPYGRPIQNARYYVLDPRRHPCPVGIEGDLYIAGACLAEGYLDAPQLTAERFMPDPFGEPGERMYRTGDRARFWADGNIEFRGRLDGQVKVRGFRVETAEIETALRKYPAVNQALVVAHDADGHGKQLAAYIVPTGGIAPTSIQLREHLATLLPHYMIPATFVALDRLPLTPNGKLDRRALPMPFSGQPDAHSRFEPPATLLEQRIAAIWEKVLRVRRVGRHDNFVELGGDSLMSVEVVAQASAIGLDISPRHVFQYPTLAQLAQLARPLKPMPQAIGLPCGKECCELPLTPIQRWFVERDLLDPENYNIVFLLDVDAAVEPRRLLSAIRQVAAGHDAFALRFDRIDGHWRQQLGEPTVLCQTADFSQMPPEHQNAAMQAALFELRHGLELDRGPLMKTLLVNQGKGWKLGLVVHHLIFDAASLRIWLHEVEAAYEHPGAPCSTGRTGYGVWARSLATHVGTPAARQWLDHWLSMPWSQVKPLPLDFPTGSNAYRFSASLQRSLDVRRTRALLHQVPQQLRMPAGEVLLAAWGRAMADWAESQVALVDVTGHGRERFLDALDVSRVIGYITTNSPAILRSHDRVPDPRPPEHSWGVLRYLCSDAAVVRSLAALPVPQVKFNFQGNVQQAAPTQLLRGPLTLPIRGTLHPDNQRAYLLNVELCVLNGQLQCQCVYSRELHDRRRIECLLDTFIAELDRVVEELGEQDGHGTPTLSSTGDRT